MEKRLKRDFGNRSTVRFKLDLNAEDRRALASLFASRPSSEDIGAFYNRVIASGVKAEEAGLTSFAEAASVFRLDDAEAVDVLAALKGGKPVPEPQAGRLAAFVMAYLRSVRNG